MICTTFADERQNKHINQIIDDIEDDSNWEIKVTIGCIIPLFYSYSATYLLTFRC